MICMQNKDFIHRISNHRVNFISFSRNRKAHMQEVFSITQLIARVVKGLAN